MSTLLELYYSAVILYKRGRIATNVDSDPPNEKDEKSDTKKERVQVADAEFHKFAVAFSVSSLQGTALANRRHVLHRIAQETRNDKLVEYVVDRLQKLQGRKIQKDVQGIFSREHDAEIDD